MMMEVESETLIRAARDIFCRHCFGLAFFLWTQRLAAKLYLPGKKLLRTVKVIEILTRF